MNNTLLIALAAMVAGTALGYILCGAFARKYQRLYRALKKGEKAGMGTMDKILVLEAAAIVVYVVADFIVFWHVGSEPSTLTACFFSVCGLENGVMGWIKTNKDKIDGGDPPEIT